MNTTMFQAKEPLLALLFGIVLVGLITLPYFYGLGRAIAKGHDDPELSVMKFFAYPVIAHFMFCTGALVFTRIWNLFYEEYQSQNLIKIFWEASSQGATNEWVKAAYNSADMAGLILYYVIIAVPVVNFIAVWMISDSILPKTKQDTIGAVKSFSIKVVASILVAAILSVFYQRTVDVVMYDGQSLNFKEWGTASSGTDMHANFYKKIAKMGATGVVSIGDRLSASPSAGGSVSTVPSTPPTSLIDQYQNILPNQ